MGRLLDIIVVGCAAPMIAGCGSSDDSAAGGSGSFPAGTTCGLVISFSGGVEASISAQDSIACATQLSSTAGIEAGFLATDGGPVQSVDLAVDTLQKAQTGQAFPATLQVHDTDGRSWKADVCNVDILSQTLDSKDSFSENYRTAGKGECSSATTTFGSDPEVAVGSFAFVATVPWTP